MIIPKLLGGGVYVAALGRRPDKRKLLVEFAPVPPESVKLTVLRYEKTSVDRNGDETGELNVAEHYRPIHVMGLGLLLDTAGLTIDPTWLAGPFDEPQFSTEHELDLVAGHDRAAGDVLHDVAADVAATPDVDDQEVPDPYLTATPAPRWWQRRS
jgi:hypothetical protein